MSRASNMPTHTTTHHQLTPQSGLRSRYRCYWASVIGLNCWGGSLMFSMPKIISPIVAPDGSIDAYCMPKVVQSVLIAMGICPSSRLGTTVSRSAPFSVFHSWLISAALTSFRSLFEINYLPRSDTMRILYPDETLTPFASNAGMWCAYVSSDNGLLPA